MEKSLKKNLLGKECDHFNEVGRKIIQFFFVLVVSPKMKLWKLVRKLDESSFKNFFFHPKIYGVNLKKIDNGPNSTTISTIAAREISNKI